MGTFNPDSHGGQSPAAKTRAVVAENATSASDAGPELGSPGRARREYIHTEHRTVLVGCPGTLKSDCPV